jgi:hypothetical protein
LSGIAQFGLNFEVFPGIKWKLMNIKKLKEQNPEKHIKQMFELKKILNLI